MLKKVIPVIAVILSVSVPYLAQTRIADLKPAHAVALEQFLSKNKKYGFLSESTLDKDYLKEMRKVFTNLRPYYNIGDYNHDGIQDFSLILSRKGKVKDNGEGMAETHRYEYPLAVVIFNGDRRGRYTKVFSEDIEAPLACFLKTERRGKRLGLYFGIFESDAGTRFFAAVGKGYIVKFPEAP